MSNLQKGLTSVIVGSILWGASGTVAELFFSESTVSTQWVVALRLLGAGILLLLWCLFTIPHQVKNLLRQPKQVLAVCLFGFLGVLPSQFTYFMAIRTGNAPTATILQFLSPLFILLYFTITKRELPRRIDSFCVFLAMFGTYLLVTKGQFNQLALSPEAFIWGILSGVSAALYTLLPRKLLQAFDAKLVTGLAMFVSGIALSPILISTDVPVLAPRNWGMLAFIVIGGTMFSYLFYIQSLQYIDASLTSMLSSFEPLTATILSVALLHTAFGLPEIIGALFILSTTFLQAWASHRELAKT
ncbi:DMT family transporter [Enterococcus alishanensis]|uniref:DMT family transporter n=1 Tax=Enterococcus alishanensis TaxID=1303817 RepID=A0ABS6TDE2_9ENTE|nr:DMT family transporter [Enterococcus alishanensis]MBV7390935.1 DMT family transporter [Enterococcus alishanensis]